MLPTKTCKDCGVEKPVGEFGLGGSGKPRPYCKSCAVDRARCYRMADKKADPVKFKKYARDKMREWRAANPVKARETARAWKRANPDKTRQHRRNAKSARPWLTVYFAARRRAKKVGQEFGLTQEWCAERYTGYCEVTGIRFELPDGKRGPFSASLDRIDPTKSYSPDNARFVIWMVNAMKGDFTDEDMAVVASKIAEKFFPTMPDYTYLGIN